MIHSFDNVLKNPLFLEIEKCQALIKSGFPYDSIERPIVRNITMDGFAWIVRYTKDDYNFISIDGFPEKVYPGLTKQKCFEDMNNVIAYLDDDQIRDMKTGMLNALSGEKVLSFHKTWKLKDYPEKIIRVRICKTYNYINHFGEVTCIQCGETTDISELANKIRILDIETRKREKIFDEKICVIKKNSKFLNKTINELESKLEKKTDVINDLLKDMRLYTSMNETAFTYSKNEILPDIYAVDLCKYLCNIFNKNIQIKNENNMNLKKILFFNASYDAIHPIELHFNILKELAENVNQHERDSSLDVLINQTHMIFTNTTSVTSIISKNGLKMLNHNCNYLHLKIHNLLENSIFKTILNIHILGN